MTIRLVLADDHPLLVDALEHLFSSSPAFQVVAKCTNGNETLETVRALLPDVLVVDIRMPGKSGLDVARQMKKEMLPSQVVLFTAELDEDHFLEAMRAGVRGIVLKELAPQLLVQCVVKVHGGGQWLERDLTGAAMQRILEREASARDTAIVLTRREIELVRLIAEGLSNKEIAGRFCISEGTVKVHMHNIYEKMKVDGRTALLQVARKMDLL